MSKPASHGSGAHASTNATTAATVPAAKPWEHAKHGEGSSTDPLAARFVESLSVDARLYDADIRGSLAHAAMLERVGLISAKDHAEIRRGLDEIRREIESAPAGPTAIGVPGAWSGWRVELEDVHMCIEAALVEKTGDAGRTLHTGRSRNDQVALDLRLWLRDACGRLAKELDALCAALRGLAQRQGDVVMPSYTHVQRAQPIVLGAECMAYGAMFARDARMLQAMVHVEDGLGASPLGSGAVAGSTLPLDRAMTAAALGFDAPSLSSIDATASRDEALDFIYACSRTALHLSRLSEQWIIYCSTEFGFVTLGEAYTTGSSMMPQKRNPDMLELIRGKAGTVLGHLMALSAIVKGLPLAYNRDLQEDKRHVFGAFDTVMDCVMMATRVVASAKFNDGRIADGLERGHLDATVLAEYFVTRGVPFRTAHQVVGALVRACDRYGRASLKELDLSEFRSALKAAGQREDAVGADVFEFLGARGAVSRYRSAGHAGTGPGGYVEWVREGGRDSNVREGEHGSSLSGALADASAGAGASNSAPSTPPLLFGDDAGEANDGTASPTRHAAAGLEGVIAKYTAIGRTLDDLPYTPEFEQLLNEAKRTHPAIGARELLRRLRNLRKQGGLPTVGRAPSLAVRLEPSEETWLKAQVERVCGTLGQRDQLPYDQRFDELLERFNAHTGRTLDPHTLWRLVAKLAK